MVLGEDVVYGVEVFASRSRETVFKPGASVHRLLCIPLKAAPGAPKTKPKAKSKGKRSRGAKALWEKKVPIRIIAIVLAGKTVFAAGPPDVVDPDDPHAAWEGRKGGVLAAFGAKDGSRLAELKLPAPPVWDGMAAAKEHLYISTGSGSVICMGKAK
jgi:hypothetical protein